MASLDYTEDSPKFASTALQRADFPRWASNIDRVSSKPRVIAQGFGCLQHGFLWVSWAFEDPLQWWSSERIAHASMRLILPESPVLTLGLIPVDWKGRQR